MKKPLISVIIPCLNGERDIEQCIESALAQTGYQVEVIVVDNGSTDSSVSIARRFGSWVKILHCKTKGAPAARNVGARAAAGKYVQLLDCDDVLLPHRFETMVPLAEALPPKCILASSRSIDGSELLEGNGPVILRDYGDSVRNALEQVITSSGPLYLRQDFLSVGGYREDLEKCQDFEFNLRLACLGYEFKFLPDRLLLVRRRNASISSNPGEVYEYRGEIIDSAVDELKSSGQMTSIRSYAFALEYARRARYYFGRGISGQGEMNLRRADSLDKMAFHDVLSLKGKFVYRVLGRKVAVKAIMAGL